MRTEWTLVVAVSAVAVRAPGMFRNAEAIGLIDGEHGRHSVRWVSFDPGLVARNSIRDQDGGTILFHRGRRRQAVSDRSHADAIETWRSSEQVRGIIFGEMLDCFQSANQDYTLQEVITTHRRGFGCARRVRRAIGTRQLRKHHPPIRCEDEAVRERWQVSLRILESAVTV